MPSNRVFLSYSRADVEWAKRLAGDLVQEGFELFFDQNSLRAGDGWEQQILSSLEDCDHLVLVWSAKAKESPWVERERGFFDSRRYRRGQRLPGHQLIHVMLDSTPYAFGSDQSITAIAKADPPVYAAGAAACPSVIWSEVVRKTVEGLGDSSMPVSRAIFTVERPLVTREPGVQADESRYVDFNYRPPGGRKLDEVLSAVGVDREHLASCYGASRLDWRPFGGGDSIHDLLERIRMALLNAPGVVPIRWASVDDDLFSDDAERIERAARRLAAGPALVVIDPVALYSRSLRDLLDFLDTCLKNPQAIVVVLPLFAPPQQSRVHTDMVRAVYRELAKIYDESPAPGQAQCSIFASDDSDIRRLMRATLRQQGTGPANPFLSGRAR
jgi:hypothetical protein